MARLAQSIWVVLLVVFVVAACSTESVTSEEETKASTLKDQALEAGNIVKKWKDWAFERSSSAYDSAKKQAIQWSEGGSGTAPGGAAETAKQYATDGAKQLYKTTSEMHESIGGYFGKWKSWAQEKAGNYKTGAKEHADNIVEKIKNPSDAFAYVNTHTSSDEEEL